ncbi:hypothetical protein YC2023_024096 [Brassica napus]
MLGIVAEAKGLYIRCAAPLAFSGFKPNYMAQGPTKQTTRNPNAKGQTEKQKGVRPKNKKPDDFRRPMHQGSRTRIRIMPHQYDTRHFRLNLTVTISRRRRSCTTANQELRLPQSLHRNQLFSSMLCLRFGEPHRSNRELIRQHKSVNHLESRTKRHTHTTNKIQNRTEELEQTKAGDARMNESSPPGDRTDDGGAEKASTSRRQEPAATEL